MKRKCDNCDNPATVHLTEIVDGEKTEKHLCEVCAANENITVKPAMGINQMVQEFLAQSQQAKRLSELVCDGCGMSFLEFRHNGLLGCPRDYSAYGEVLVSLLQRAHEGADQHIGKVPKRAGTDQHRQNELLRLRAALKDAVGTEDYEQAAAIRDQIQELETL